MRARATSGGSRRPLLWVALAVALGACDEKLVLPICAIAEGDPDFQAIETRCDGIDNDCDGQVDVLMPLSVNACTTGAAGNCGRGFVGCRNGEALCLTPPPMPESRNGQDDDCNGIADDVTATGVHTARARLLVAEGVWADVGEGGPARNDGPARSGMAVLAQAGLDFDAPDLSDAYPEGDWDAAFAKGFDDYSLIFIAGYVDSEMFRLHDPNNTAKPLEQFQTLRQWVARGGTLVWMKPVPPDIEMDLTSSHGRQARDYLDLAGVTGATSRQDADTIEIAANAPAAYFLDSAEERKLPILPGDPSAVPPTIWTYTPAAGANVAVFGHARAHNVERGAVFLRRPFGRGAVYTLGWDPLQEAVSHCYVNCFSPGRDVAVGLFRALARESAHGHAVLRHTVPGVEETVMVVTHDVDAPDAHNANVLWGEPGAVQSVQIERALGLAGSYFVTTDYWAGYFNPGLIAQMCDLGICPDAAHSVRHTDMTGMPPGTCDENRGNYDPGKPTVCGEVRVSLEILQSLLPSAVTVRAWRTPYLQTPTSLYPALEKHGIVYDSSFAVGDATSNFPIFVPHDELLRGLGGVGNVYTFPIVQEDGIGDSLDDGSYVRKELQEINRDLFIARWTGALLGNLRNNAWNIFLLHPSYGIGTNAANLAVKLGAMQAFLTRAKTLDVHFARITEAGDFWRGRDNTAVRAVFTPGGGYAGTITTGAFDAPQFSLEFGDDLAAFDCPTGGATTLRGNRVVFRAPLAKKTAFAFTATTK